MGALLPNAAMRHALGLAAWLGLAFVAAGVGAVASINAREFYAMLRQPSWAPPGSVFGPVWSVLYALMGIAAWLVWRKHGVARARTALTLFLVQLAANALWSWLFFAWHRGALAFVEILVLWTLIVATVVTFRRLQPVAALLLVPYLAWVTFAAALNFAVWRLNPGALS